MMQPQFENLLALDTCILVEMLMNRKVANQVLRLFKGNHSRIVLQDVVLKETQNLLKIPKEMVIEKVSFLLKKEVYIFATTDEMRAKASIIEGRYGVCHFPDSIILVAAKMFSWTVLTLDKNMLRTADFEGIIALNPKRVGRY
jgi:predicted nucleic acid-binding protein